MPLVASADRVKETTTSTGTTVTLAGAVTGFQSFATAFPSNPTAQVTYGITSGTSWETGQGTFTLSGTTLSRDTIYGSSNAGAAITLSGTSTVYLTGVAAHVADAPTVQAQAVALATAVRAGMVRP